MKPVLICGGVGTKMWPLSRQKKPKHFLPLFNGKSLFKINYENLLSKFSPKKIYVQTTLQQLKLVRDQAPEIPLKNIFLEPELRNHGPAMGLMAVKLAKIDPDEPFTLIQVDVIRKPNNKYLEMIDCLEKLVLEKRQLVTGGIKPKFAVMGIDYLIAKKKISQYKKTKVYKMDKWIWRNSKENTKKYLKRSALFAHANHYTWTPKLLLESYKKIPSWHKALVIISKSLGSTNEKQTIKTEYSKMEKGPVELVFKDELKNGYIVELPFEWTDFGTWESLDKYSGGTKKKADNNVLEIESDNCFIQKDKDKFISLVGVSDLIIVDTKDALLVCKKEKSELVGEVVKSLEKSNRRDLL